MEFSMQILKKQKLAEILTANWTKYLDYKTLMSIAINTVQLYASNWSLLEYNKKIQGNKITISKTMIKNHDILFYLDFEIQISPNFAIGTIEIFMDLEGKFKIHKVHGNIFHN